MRITETETRLTRDNSKVNPQVIVLGAGLPYRGSKPSALSPMPDHRRALDWIFDAFSTLKASFHYVGGYQVNEVATLYKAFSISINPDWQFTGNVASLFTAPLSDQRACYVCYSDVVFRRNVVERLAAATGDVVLAVDFDWQRRYGARADEDLRAAEKVKLKDGVAVAVGSHLKVADAQAEFTGLVKFSGDAMRQIMQLRESAGDSLRRASLPALIDKLSARSIEIRIVDVNGDWAELNAPQDLARFVLGTKAETLGRLRPLVRKSVIGEQVRLTLEKWKGDRKASVDQVTHSFRDKRIIVRSSALTEDSWSTTNAGAFLSLLNIAGNSREGIASAIDRVFASYGDDNHGHQVLVQEMVFDVRICGVALTRSLNYGAPYYVINYDDAPLDTESVTSGSGQDLKTLVIHRSSQLVPDGVPEGLQLFLEALWELEELVGHDSLDVEFAITSGNDIHIFQLRPIAVDHSDWHGTDDTVADLLATAVEIFHVKQVSSPFVVGRRAMFGIMPDWNPAEIIGTNPRRLAVSLYRHLVTDEVWAAQRAEYGYRDVRPQPLMVLFAGRPYIDIRASFNSFLPEQLDDALAEKLVDHYLDRLEANPHLHDKVEFDVAFTSFTFDFDMRADRLREAGFSPSEISQLADALREISRQAFYRNDEDLAKVKRLEQRFEQTMRTGMNPLDRAYLLLADCRRHGTLPFSHLARSAFVAVNLLRSAAARGIIETSTVSDFLGSLKTVAKDLSHDAKDVANGKLAWESFCERYGHLRPGTYDITVPSYSEDPEHFLRPLVEQAGQAAQEAEKKEFSWSSEQSRSMAEALRSIDFPDDIDLFDRFLRQVIEGREYAKFAFTRNLNAALHDLAEFAAELGLTRDQVSHIPLEDLYALLNGECPADVDEWLQNKAEEGASWHKHGLGIELPPLLIRPDNFYRFLYPKTQPNFIGDDKVTGSVVRLDDDADTTGDVAGKIVLIPQADPGYDWLLGHGVSGLITAYGGTNSHMAIRAAEFRLPAAIGVGQTQYNRLAHAEIICLDCQNRRIEIVR